ncbi:MAG: DCC1-like thiol-disulfide oxidoreductase family protein [Paracoccus sp. (in: a-proteobacteria)]|uniref:DCC1-like thiol-disulfide oxidoreductase family protein n=1 Tax=Paracoccus sp. TaxID=267 RepID=UPI002E867F27|nr:DCC1-like thiol-disulfide oxidoreductase family protein [Pseudomonadota bacterium]
MNLAQDEGALIVYDGDCIFCQNYVKLVRLRDMVGKVELLDARSDDPRVRDFQRQGYDLNEGMLFVHRGRVHHGSDAVHMMALLSSSSDSLNRLNRRLLSNPKVAKAIYPALKLGRRATLFLRRRSLIPQGSDID